MKRLFDLFFSIIGLAILLPFFVIIGLAIVIDSRGGVFYLQSRVGKGNKDFKLYKFRTMATGSDKKGLLTVGAKDSRITKVGYFLRKYKLDELPQLINVLIGNMSFVGPRPEVRKYVDLYNKNQLRVLEVKPGITDIASYTYFEENELLSKSDNPEKTYIEVVMPDKININLEYLKKRSILKDFGIVFKTVLRIFK